jgi:hypothetical protein
MKRKRAAVFTIGFAAFVFCAPAWAQNSNLNAPVSRQPTVGSEIERGQEVGFQCGLDYRANFSKFRDCVNNAISTNRQSSTLSEPYEFGLYVRALQHSYVQGIALNSDGMLPIWRDRLMRIMKSRKLSFGDFCKAAGSEGGCDATKFNEQTYGSGTTTRTR